MLVEICCQRYAEYRRLRESDPVHRDANGIWLLSRYRDVAAVLRDFQFGRKNLIQLLEKNGGLPETEINGTLLFEDPPEHTRLRALVAKAFTPSLMESFRPRVGAIADRLLDPHSGSNKIDLIRQFAELVPVVLMTEMLGVLEPDRDQFLEWAREMAASREVRSESASKRVVKAQQAMTTYFRDLIRYRQEHPGTDLVSALMAAEQEGDRLSESEVLHACNLLFVAGHETTINLIGNTTILLLQHPEEMARVQSNPDLLSGAVEESLRCESPVQRVVRIANSDVELAGKRISKGALISAIIAAANRDPERFPDPDRFVVVREPNHHLAFGWGAHFCIGAALARLEAAGAIGALLQRFPQMQLEDGGTLWRDSAEIRGLRELQVRLR
ncbi:MAG TPA: cytochrome P450 [Bryobacteraceae bacterium]